LPKISAAGWAAVFVNSFSPGLFGGTPKAPSQTWGQDPWGDFTPALDGGSRMATLFFRDLEPR
jgi:hypothetical protein